jgi:hypothetical protein
MSNFYWDLAYTGSEGSAMMEQVPAQASRIPVEERR